MLDGASNMSFFSVRLEEMNGSKASRSDWELEKKLTLEKISFGKIWDSILKYRIRVL